MTSSYPRFWPWIEETFSVTCCSVTELPVDRSSNLEIFLAGREAGASIMSKDSDFIDLVSRLGVPPQLLWVTGGNRSNSAFKALLLETFEQALELLQSGEPVVEIS